MVLAVVRAVVGPAPVAAAVVGAVAGGVGPAVLGMALVRRAVIGAVLGHGGRRSGDAGEGGGDDEDLGDSGTHLSVLQVDGRLMRHRLRPARSSPQSDLGRGRTGTSYGR